MSTPKWSVMLSSVGGQNSAISSDLLEETQYFRGVNISSRRGKPHTRPPLRRITLGGTASLFENNRFQGADVFKITGGDIIVAVCGGQVIGIDVNTWEVFDYQKSLGATVTRCYFAQPDKFFVVQDGINTPVICNFDDVPTHARYAFREDPSDPSSFNEVPTGTVMDYGHGRLFVAVEQVGTDLFGDPQNVGSRFFEASDFMLPNDPKNVLRFTETDYLNGGGAFALPNELGLIRGIRFMRNADTGTGWGECFVFAEHGVSRFAFEGARSTWANIDISRVAFTGAGTLSPYSIIPVNSDLMFRGTDGIRSILYTSSKIRENAGGLANEPMSAEVADLLANDNRQFLQYTSAAYIDDRVLMTTFGELVGDQPTFKSIVSLDGNAFSSMSAPAQPAYDGIWTGLQFLQLAVAKDATEEKGLVIALDGNGKNAIYEIDDSEYRDGGVTPTQSRFYSRSETYESPASLKRLQYTELYLSGIRGPVSVTVYYRPHGYPLWTSMGTATMDADPSGLAQSRRRIRFGVDDDSCEPAEQNKTFTAMAFQFCVECTGKVQIERLISKVEVDEIEDDTGTLNACKLNSDEVLLQAGAAGVALDDYEYEIAT